MEFSGDDIASDRIPDSRGRIVSECGGNFLVAYKKADSEKNGDAEDMDDDGEESKYSVFEFSSRLVRRHWTQSQKTEIGDGDGVESREFSMFTNRDKILDEPNSATDGSSVHDMEPTYLKDGDPLDQRLSLALLKKALEVRMLGNINDEQSILRDHLLDQEHFDDPKIREEMERRIGKIKNLISSDSNRRNRRKDRRYQRHPHYCDGQELIRPLSRRAILAYYGSDLFDEKGFQLNELEYFVTSRNGLYRFGDDGEPKAIEASPIDGDGHVYFTIHSSNKRRTKVKRIYLPKMYAMFWTFTSCHKCAPEDFSKNYQMLDHGNMIRDDDFPLNGFPFTTSDNNKVKWVNNRNNSSGFNGVAASAKTGLWHARSVDRERIRTGYNYGYLALTRRFYEESSHNWRDGYSANHLLLEVLNSENFRHVAAKEVLRCLLIPSDFHRCSFGENQADNYDQMCLDTGTDIDIVSILDNLNESSGTGHRPTLFGDLFIKRFDASVIGEPVDHLLKALHLTLVSKKRLLPSTALDQFIFDLKVYASGHQQYIQTANRMDIGTECTDTNFLNFLSLENLPMVDLRVDLTALPISNPDGKYELLACSHKYDVTIVVWEELSWDEQRGNKKGFRNLAKYKAPEEGLSDMMIHLAINRSFGHPKWQIMDIGLPDIR